MKNKTREIELYIEELVLDGFALSERHAIADALISELEILLRDSAFVADAEISELQFDRLNAGSITMRADERRDRLGAQVGRALFQSLNSVTRQSTSSSQVEKDPKLLTPREDQGKAHA